LRQPRIFLQLSARCRWQPPLDGYERHPIRHRPARRSDRASACSSTDLHSESVPAAAEPAALRSAAATTGTQTFLVRQGIALVPDVVQYSDIDTDSQTDWLNQFGSLSCGSIEL
jgi:hypothetical protein